MYNFNHLYYFYITAKSGGVTTAAKHLKISQPSLSSQLRVLEEMLDMRLFHKVGRNNELTKAGSVIYGFCRRMFELSEEMTESILEGVPSATRRIHIGVSDEVERSFVVEVVSLFLKKLNLAQRPKVMITSAHREELVERLRFRELDAVVTPLAITDPELVNLRGAEVPVILTCSSKWKIRTKPKALTAVSALQQIIEGDNVQWIMPSPTFKLRSEIESFMETNNLKGRIVFESDVMASLVRSVTDEIGVAFLPLLYVTREIREKTLRILGPKGGFWKYRVWLSCHNQSQNDVLIRSLASSFKEISDQAIV